MERAPDTLWGKMAGLALEAKKNHEITLQGIFHAHKKGFGFGQSGRGRGTTFVGKWCQLCFIDGDTVEVVIKRIADHPNREQQRKPRLSIS